MGSDSPGYINVVISENASHSCFLAAIEIPLFSNKQILVKDFTELSVVSHLHTIKHVRTIEMCR